MATTIDGGVVESTEELLETAALEDTAELIEIAELLEIAELVETAELTEELIRLAALLVLVSVLDRLEELSTLDRLLELITILVVLLELLLTPTELAVEPPEPLPPQAASAVVNRATKKVFWNRILAIILHHQKIQQTGCLLDEEVWCWHHSFSIYHLV